MRSCLAALVAAAPPGPPHLLSSSAPSADAEVTDEPRGCAAASLRSLLLSPLDPLICSPPRRPRLTPRSPTSQGDAQLPRCARCFCPPWTPSFALLLGALG